MIIERNIQTTINLIDDESETHIRDEIIERMESFMNTLQEEYSFEPAIVLTMYKGRRRMFKAESKRAGAKSKKPDGFPKRPASSYIEYVKDMKGSGMDVKELSQKWNEMDEKKKSVYERIAEKNKKVYEQEVEKFYEEHPESRPPPKKPTKAKNSYQFFLKDFNAKNAKKLKKIKDIQDSDEKKEARAKINEARKNLWEKIKETPKKLFKYEEMHEKDVSRYENELDAFKEKHPDIEINTPKSSGRNKNSSGKPKRAMNPYQAFLAEIRGQGMSGEERKKKWASIKEDEKEFARFQKIADDDYVNRYLKQVDVYNDNHPDDMIQLSPKATPRTPKSKKSKVKDETAPTKPPNTYSVFRNMVKDVGVENIAESLEVGEDTKMSELWKLTKENDTIHNSVLRKCNENIKEYNEQVEKYNDTVDYDKKLSPMKYHELVDDGQVSDEELEKQNVEKSDESDESDDDSEESDDDSDEEIDEISVLGEQ